MAKTDVAIAPGSCDLNREINRNWAIQVKKPGAADGEWKFVRGLKSLNPNISTTAVDSSDIDSNGFESQTKTSRKFTITMKGNYARAAGADAALDDGVKLLRDHGIELGAAGCLDVRVWRTDGDDEAWQAKCSIEFSADDGDANALRTFTVTAQAVCAPQRIKPVVKGAELKASVDYSAV